MSASSAVLEARAVTYRKALEVQFSARQQRDAAKRTIAEAEASARFRGVSSGALDGKNAETRDAQFQTLLASDVAYQAALTAFILAEEAYQEASMRVNIETVDLKVAAALLNFDIAQTGANRILVETSLGTI